MVGQSSPVARSIGAAPAGEATYDGGRPGVDPEDRWGAESLMH